MNVSLPVNILDFPEDSPWAHLNTQTAQAITFTWSDILRAAMVAGYPDLASIPSPQFAQWRTAGLHLALRHSAGKLVQPPEVSDLDPSEKAAVSSLLGVIMTKLLVEKLLAAPIFLFLDVYFSLAYPDNQDKIRPDFAAMTAGHEWFSVEAKGRSRYRRATLNGGKKQAEALGTINGQPVLTGIVCVTSFRGGKMQAHLADPPTPPGKSFALLIDPMEALEKYYRQVTRFAAVSEPPPEADLAATDLEARLLYSPALDVTFGIIPDLEAALEVRSFERATFALKRAADRQSGSDRDPYLGPDGIIVIPGNRWEKDG